MGNSSCQCLLAVVNVILEAGHARVHGGQVVYLLFVHYFVVHASALSVWFLSAAGVLHCSEKEL